MKTYDSYITELDSRITNRNFDKLSLVLALIATLISIGSAFAISQFGVLILLIIPALIFLIVAFLQPDYGLAIFIFISVTQISNVGIQFYGMPSISQPLAGLLMVVILFRIAMYRELPIKWGRIVLVLIIYIFALFFSMVTAANINISSSTFLGFIKNILGGVIVVLLIQRPASFRQAIWAMIIAGIFMGTISVLQAATKTYDNSYFGFGGWEMQSAGEQSRYRLTGSYANPNAYSQVMIVIFILALERFWHEKRSLLRIFAGWAAIVSSLTIVLTYSRGGAITLFATIGILFLQNRPPLLPVLITILAGLVLLQFLPAGYVAHISTLQEIIPTQNNNQIYDQSIRGRLSENIAAWRMFLNDPLFGVGLGNFEIQYQNYSRQIGLDSRRESRSPASLYLEILSQQGLMGVASFILLIYTLFAGLISARLQFAWAGMQDQSNITMALLTGFAGYLIEAVIKNSAYSNVFWILVGMAISAAQVALFCSREKSDLIGFVRYHD